MANSRITTDSMQNNHRVLSSGEVARYCGVHFRTVIRWIEKGRLKSHKLPGRGNNRISETDFIAFLINNNMPIPEPFQATSKRILIVDDEKAMAAAIQRAVRRAGYETETAYNGFQAGNALASFQPALITLDLSMPTMDGFEVLHFITNNHQYDNLKIIVISALSDEKLALAKEAGAHACLSKPFHNDDLIITIQGLLYSTNSHNDNVTTNVENNNR